LYEYLQDVQSLLAPGIAAVFLLGVVSKRTTPAAGLMGITHRFYAGYDPPGSEYFSSGIPETSLLYKIFLVHNWLHYEIYLFFLVIISMVIISYFTKPKDPLVISGLTLGTASKEQIAETRASYNYWDIINSVIIITIILVFMLTSGNHCE
jgi:solute:Na+ symporter, SSS family